MKKLLFILLMAVSATAFSQKVLYKIDKIIIFDIENEQITGERVLHMKPTILIDINKSLMTITYADMSQVKFVLMDYLETETKKDSEGDTYSIIRYLSVDQEGNRCRLSFVIYDEFTNIKVYTTYSDKSYCFDGIYISTSK